MLPDFVELTFANELDVLEHAAELRAKHGRGLASLFGSIAHLASPGAINAFRNELADLIAPSAS